MGILCNRYQWVVCLLVSSVTAVAVELPGISVYVENSPVAQDLIEQASRLKHEGRTADAISIYQQVIEQYPRKLINIENGIHTDIAGWIRKIILSDTPLLTSYRSLQSGTANRKLAEALSLDTREKALEHVLASYWLCPAGLQAGLYLTGIYLERGEIHIARSILKELHGHPDLKTQANLWHQLHAAVGAFGKEPARYESHLKALQQLGQIDTAQKLDSWVQQLDQPLTTKSYDSFSVLPKVKIPDTLGVPLWEKLIAKNNDQALHPVQRHHRRRVRLRTRTRLTTRYASVVPVASEDRLYFANTDSVHALDQSSGREIWSFRTDTSDHLAKLENHRIIGRTLFGSGQTTDQRAVLVSNHYVVSVLGMPTTVRPGLRQGGEGTSLVCLNRHNGQPIWHVGVGDLDPTLGTAQFYGTPMAGIDGIHVLALRTERSGFRDVYILTINATTGTLKWRRHLFSVAAGRSGLQGLVGMTRENSRLFVADGFGNVACLDSRRGRIWWLSITSNQQNNTATNKQTARVSALNGLATKPLLVEAGLIIDLRNKLGGAILLDPLSGRIRNQLNDDYWKQAWYITKTPGGILLVGPTIQMLDGNSLEVRWEKSFDSSGISTSPNQLLQGLVSVTTDRVLIPIHRGVAILDIANGRVIDRHQVIESGNLLALPGQIVIAGIEAVRSYLSWDQAYEQLTKQIRAHPDDPEPGLALAHVSLAANKHDGVIEGIDCAIEALALQNLITQKLDSDITGTSQLRQQAQRNVFTQLLGLINPDNTPSKHLRHQIFNRLALVTTNPADEVAYHLTYGTFLVTSGEIENAVDHYQSILQNPLLASEMHHHESGRRQAGLEAKSRLEKLVEENGSRIYAKYESEAAAKLVELTHHSPQDVSKLIELSKQYALSRSAPVATYTAAEILTKEGHHLAAIGHLRRAYRQAKDASLIQRITGLMTSIYEKTGQPHRALRWLERVQHDHPNLMPLRQGRPISMNQLTALLAGQTEINRGLPHIPQPMGKAFILPEKLLTPIAQDRGAWPRDRILTLASGVIRLREKAHLNARWEYPIQSDKLQLLSFTETQVLLWNPTDGLLTALDSSGKLAWPQVDVALLLEEINQTPQPPGGSPPRADTAAVKPEARKNRANMAEVQFLKKQAANANAIVNAEGGDHNRTLPRQPSSISIASNELYICAVDNEGNIVCIDRHTGTVAWRWATFFEHLTTIKIDDDVVVLAGQKRAHTGLDHDGVLVLDTVTGESLFPLIEEEHEVQWIGLTGEGLLLYSTDQQLVAYDLRNGQTKWGLELGEMDLSGRGWASHDLILLETGRFNGTLLALNPLTGQIDEQITNLFPHTSRRLTLEKSNDNWYVLTPAQAVALDPRGNPRWYSAIYQEPNSELILELIGQQSVVLIKQQTTEQGESKHTLYVLNREHGTLIEQHDLGPIAEPIDPNRAVVLEDLLILSTASITIAIPPNKPKN